eukprot:1626442-Rhodomonas_salina.2
MDAVVTLLASAMREPAFDELRTKQQALDLRPETRDPRPEVDGIETLDPRPQDLDPRLWVLHTTYETRHYTVTSHYTP